MTRIASSRLTARRRGVTLIESTLVMAVAAAVVAAGLEAASVARTDTRMARTTQMIDTITTQTRALHMNLASFGEAGDDITTRIATRMDPLRGVDAGAAEPMVTPISAPVRLHAVGGHFALTLHGLDRAECTRLARADSLGDGPMGRGIVGMAVMPDDAIDGFDITRLRDPGRLPVRISDAAEICGDAVTLAVAYSR